MLGALRLSWGIRFSDSTVSLSPVQPETSRPSQGFPPAQGYFLTGCLCAIFTASWSHTGHFLLALGWPDSQLLRIKETISPTGLRTQRSTECRC